jgi:Fe-S-cluster containining protein
MRCAIYADRPEMCRAYPDGKACEHCGLTGGYVQKGGRSG